MMEVVFHQVWSESQWTVLLRYLINTFYLSIYPLGRGPAYSNVFSGTLNPTHSLTPYAEAFYSRPIALTLGGEEFSVNDVCKCMRDCRVGWAEYRREQLVRYL